MSDGDVTDGPPPKRTDTKRKNGADEFYSKHQKPYEVRVKVSAHPMQRVEEHNDNAPKLRSILKKKKSATRNKAVIEKPIRTRKGGITKYVGKRERKREKNKKKYRQNRTNGRSRLCYDNACDRSTSYYDSLCCSCKKIEIRELLRKKTKFFKYDNSTMNYKREILNQRTAMNRDIDAAYFGQKQSAVEVKVISEPKPGTCISSAGSSQLDILNRPLTIRTSEVSQRSVPPGSERSFPSGVGTVNPDTDEPSISSYNSFGSMLEQEPMV